MVNILQGLLAVPFVLHSQPTAVFEPNGQTVEQMASVAQRRYAEIMRDVEEIVNDHSKFLRLMVRHLGRFLQSLSSKLNLTNVSFFQ